MQLTQSENQQARRENAAFMAQCEAYKKLLADKELPLTLNLEELKTAYRMQLFTQLLEVDAGLKMRYDFAKTDEGRLKLVTETVDLTGHEIVDVLDAQIKRLHQSWSQMQFKAGPFYLQAAQSGQRLAGLLSGYGLSLPAWLDACTFKWEGEDAEVLAYFQNAAKGLQELRDLMKRYDAGANLGRAFGRLDSFFAEPEGAAGPVVVNEHAVFNEMRDAVKAKGLHKRGALAPKAQA